MDFILHSVNIVFILIFFSDIKPIFSFLEESPFVCGLDSFFICCWLQFPSLLLRIFESVFIGEINLCFWCQVNSGPIE